jgi:hypothetical protein
VSRTKPNMSAVSLGAHSGALGYTTSDTPGRIESSLTHDRLMTVIARIRPRVLAVAVAASELGGLSGRKSADRNQVA